MPEKKKCAPNVNNPYIHVPLLNKYKYLIENLTQEDPLFNIIPSSWFEQWEFYI